MRHLYWNELLLVLAPLVIAVLLITREITQKQKTLRRLQRIKTTTMTSSADEEQIKLKQKLDIIAKDQSWPEMQIEKLNKVGMNVTLRDVAMKYLLFIVGFMAYAIAILRAGPILILGMGIYGVVFYTYLLYEKRNELKKGLQQQFFFILRNISSQLSAGKLFQNAVEEIIKSSDLSPIMYVEMNNVYNAMNAGSKQSSAFYTMYYNLDIPEIKQFADSLLTFEQVGGNINSIIQSQTDFFFEMKEIDDQMLIYRSKLDTQIKFVGGIPIILISGISIFMKDFFGNFFLTPIGQVAGLACFGVMIFGIYFSKKQMEIA